MVEVGTPAARRPLTDPGVRFAGTGLRKPPQFCIRKTRKVVRDRTLLLSAPES